MPTTTKVSLRKKAHIDDQRRNVFRSAPSGFVIEVSPQIFKKYFLENVELFYMQVSIFLNILPVTKAWCPILNLTFYHDEFIRCQPERSNTLKNVDFQDSVELAAPVLRFLQFPKI